MNLFNTQPNTEPLGPGQLTLYKFRAECEHDVKRFEMLIGIATERIAAESCSPDVTATFESTMTLAEIRAALDQIVDGHVMKQTVQPIGEYTGDRDYNL